jgi:GT2 family glycosyltransferase
MNARGGGLYCVPQAAVYHVGGATLKKSNPHKTYLNFRNNLLLLYKNMPQDRFARVMRMRLLLDYVAAFKFLLCGGWGDFKAVLKARRDYYRMRACFSGDRERNLALTVAPQEETAPFLLWRYYARGKKRFSSLHGQ